MKTLVLNSGSSSIKYSLFDMADQHVTVSGLMERIGEATGRHRWQIHLHGRQPSRTEQPAVIDNHQQGLHMLFNLLGECGALNDVNELFCIGHRVVHGGEQFRQPAIIDEEVIARIKAMIPLAPLHNPANLLGIEHAIAQLPTVPQVAVFDTAFHQTIPPQAFHYAVPAEWYRHYGVRRYGFHGTSHYYVAKRAAKYLGKELAQLNLITLHLGNGASMTAIAKGRSVDTTMGLTPLEGLMMGTRCGDIDPALPFFLARLETLSLAEIETRFNKHSGLKGICGENDMRGVHRLAEQGDESARLALAMYCYRIKKYLGAYYAILGQVDAIVFTGGIGENDAWLREECCANLDALGIRVDSGKNHAGTDECYAINGDDAAVSILVIKTNEELEIATQAAACVEQNRSRH